MALTAPPPGSTPLTSAQEGLWYFQQLDPGNPILNTGQYLELSGPLNRAALRDAMERTVAETGALRLRFAQGAAGPVQWLADTGPVLAEQDLGAAPDPLAAAQALMAQDSGTALDLAHDQNAAFTLFDLGDDRHLLYQRIHHLAIDGYGMVLLTNRIAEHYNHLTADGPAPLPFRDIATAGSEDAAYAASPAREADAAWWRAELAERPAPGGPATERIAPPPGPHHFHRSSQQLPRALLAQLAEWSDAHQLNWTDVLTGLSGAYLARYSGGTVTAGLPFMARIGRKIARLPCMAMNVLPQRIQPDEDAPLADWLTPLAARMREARRHGLYRAEHLRRDLGLLGAGQRLYGPLINLQPFDRPPVFAGLSCTLHILGAGAIEDLTLTFRGDPASGMLFEVDANPDLYDLPETEGHAARLPAFIATALTAGRLAPVPTASPAEVAVQDALNATEHPLPDSSLTALLEAQLRVTPDAPALVYGDTSLDNAQLDQRSAALAAELQRRGAGADRIVAVLLNRALELPLALLAVLRAGAGFLPLDPEQPPERLAALLAQAQPVTVLTSPDLAGLLPADAPVLLTPDWPATGQPSGTIDPGHLAYVIFTSGSTGTPKGVMVEHRAIVNRLLWMRDHYGITAADRILQKTPATFDVSVWEFLLPLLSGATLVMAPPGAHRDPAALAGLIRKHGITTLHFVPSMLAAFLAAPDSAGLHLPRVFCSGEELPAELRDRFHARIRGELHNLYGPTEAAVDVSFWPASPEDTSAPVPIGWPVWNTELRVLDERVRPVPPGMAGQLFLGGVQLARGYLGRPDLTSAAFVPDPQRPGQRLYATGDLALRRPDGAVVYLGRADQQVKIRGMRIEPGEIEAAILATGLAAAVAVVARSDSGVARLVSYVVPAAGYRPGAIAEQIARVLPGWMMPAAEVVLAALPLSANGKLDRKALPAPGFSATGRAVSGTSEQLLARLFTEVLQLPETPPAEADFFALGGDSLSAVRLAQRLSEETGQNIGIGAVFATPELAALARQLGNVTDGLAPLLLLADGDATAVPLVLLHPAGGIGWGYRALARALGGTRQVWALQHPALDPAQPLPASLAALAGDYLARLAAAGLSGPLHLAGWSVGGLIAHEMAVQIGAPVGMLALLDSYPAEVWRAEPDPGPVAALRALLAIAGHDPDGHPELDSREKVVAFLQGSGSALGTLPAPVLDAVVRLVGDTNRLVRGHHHGLWPGRLLHIRAGADHAGRALRAELWAPHAVEITSEQVPFLHPEMISPAAVAQIAPLLAAAMSAHGEGQRQRE